MPERSLIPVGIVPPEARLAVALFDIDKINKRADTERKSKDYASRVIREAFAYRPVLVIEIDNALQKTLKLLFEQGHHPNQGEVEPRGKTIDQAVAEKVETYNFRAPIARDVRQSTASSVLKEIARTFHPDSNNSPKFAADALSEEERTRAISKAVEAVKTQNPEDAQRILLETMPKYYLHFVKRLMQQGLSLSEVVAEHPDILPEMEKLRWIAFLRFLPDSLPRRFKTFKDTDREAANIRNEADLQAKTLACVMILSAYGEIMAFGLNRGLEVAVVTKFKDVQDGMKRAFGYVAGTDKFVVQHGDRLLIAGAANLALNLEEQIKGFPDKIFTLTEVVTGESVDSDGLRLAFLGILSTLDRVYRAALNYGTELEDEANGRRQRQEIISLFDKTNQERSFLHKNPGYTLNSNLYDQLIRKLNKNKI